MPPKGYTGLRPLPQLIFSSRWLQLPLYLGLIVAQCVYVVLFLKELWHLVSHATEFNEQQIMLVVLGLIDVVMISNLLVMVIVGGYETFVSRLDLDGHPDQPEWLSHVNASVLKIKLAMAIIGISSIHLLRTFIEAGRPRHRAHCLHGNRRDVADDHPLRLHPLGDRHRGRRPHRPVGGRAACRQDRTLIAPGPLREAVAEAASRAGRALEDQAPPAMKFPARSNAPRGIM